VRCRAGVQIIIDRNGSTNSHAEPETNRPPADPDNQRRASSNQEQIEKQSLPRRSTLSLAFPEKLLLSRPRFVRNLGVTPAHTPVKLVG
jgi:hypothetical protein